MKVYILFFLAAIFCFTSVQSKELKKTESQTVAQDTRQKNPYGIAEKDVAWMREATLQQ